MICCNRARLNLCVAYMFCMKRVAAVDKHMLRRVCDRVIHGLYWDHWSNTTEFRVNPKEETIHAASSAHFKRVHRKYRETQKTKTEILLKEAIVKRGREKLKKDETQLQELQERYGKRQKKLKGLVGSKIIPYLK